MKRTGAKQVGLPEAQCVVSLASPAAWYTVCDAVWFANAEWLLELASAIFVVVSCPSSSRNLYRFAEVEQASCPEPKCYILVTALSMALLHRIVSFPLDRKSTRLNSSH